MSKLVALPLIVLFLVCAACQSTAGPKPLQSAARFESRGISESQVSADTVQFLRQFEGRLSWASYEIQNATTDPMVRRSAMLWRILLVPAAQSAAFQPTPTRGLIDLWALVLQIDHYVRDGEGRALFGEHQPIAIAACAALVESIRELEPDLPGEDPGVVRARIERWAAENPISGRGFSRPSTASTMANLLGQEKQSIGATVRSIDERIADLTERVTVYAGSLPRQSRWQAELIVDGFLRLPAIEGLFRDMAVTADGVARVAELEQILQKQVNRIEGLVETERAEVMRDVERQRVESLAALTVEREAILENVDRQRVATVEVLEEQVALALDTSDVLAKEVLASVRETREEMLQLVDEEHRRVFADAEVLAERTVDRSMGEARSLVDHIVLRAVQGGAALILLASVAAVAYRKLTG